MTNDYYDAAVSKRIESSTPDPGKDEVLHLPSKWGPPPQLTKEDGHMYLTITANYASPIDTMLAKNVLMTFGVPRPSPEHVVHHRNGNKGDNSPENLEWRTAIATTSWETS